MRAVRRSRFCVPYPRWPAEELRGGVGAGAGAGTIRPPELRARSMERRNALHANANTLVGPDRLQPQPQRYISGRAPRTSNL